MLIMNLNFNSIFYIYRLFCCCAVGEVQVTKYDDPINDFTLYKMFNKLVLALFLGLVYGCICLICRP